MERYLSPGSLWWVWKHLSRQGQSGSHDLIAPAQGTVSALVMGQMLPIGVLSSQGDLYAEALLGSKMAAGLGQRLGTSRCSRTGHYES